MADPSIADLQKAEQEARWHWSYVRDISSGFGRETAEAARINHQLAVLNLNRALRNQEGGR